MKTVTAEERARLLAAFDALVADDPIRSRPEIEAELWSPFGSPDRLVDARTGESRCDRPRHLTA